MMEMVFLLISVKKKKNLRRYNRLSVRDYVLPGFPNLFSGGYGLLHTSFLES